MTENEVKGTEMIGNEVTKENTEYQDNDYKYYMQDAGKVYIGARYTYADLMEHEMVSFKLKSIFEHYIMKDTQPDTSIESQFYYMTADQFSYRTYMQLKAKVKVCILAEKKTLFGKSKIAYQDRLIPLNEFVQMNLAQKKKYGVKIQEISISKLAMMAFSV